MRSPLRKRLPRELRGDFGKFAVIFLFLAATIGFVSGFLVAGNSMVEAYDESFEKYNIEDGNFVLEEPVDAALTELLAEEGVTLYDNAYIEASSDGKSDSGTENTLRIFRLRQEVNLACLMKGEFPRTAEEIALDRMYADNNDIEAGDTIRVAGKELTVSGLVALSDYSALFSDNGDMMFDSVKFGVALMTEEGFGQLDVSQTFHGYSWKYDETPEDETEEKERSEELLGMLAGHSTVTKFIPRYANQAIQFTGEDMGSDRSMMVTLLYVLIIIMAFVFGVTTNNTITKEAAVIGTLRSSGYTRGELLRHYLAIPLLTTLAACVVGNALGYTVFKQVVADMYYGSYSLPTYETVWNGWAFVTTTVIPFILMLVINLILIASKLRLSPLQFLRRDLSRSKRKKAMKLPHFKFFNRFRLRIIFQNMPGYVTLFLGIVFANVILMFGIMMIPLLDHFQEEILDNMISEYQYVLKAPLPTETEDAESYSVISLKTIPDYFESEGISAYGVQEDSAYVKADLPEEGVLVSDGYLEKYRMEVGDEITLKEAYGDGEYTFTIAGAYDYPAALAIFMSQDMFEEVFDVEEGSFNGYFSREEITDIDENYISTVITEEDLTKVSRQLDVSMGSMFQMVKVFALVLFALLIYLMTKLIIEKNASSISMVKILGYDTREIGRLYVTATTWVVVLSVAGSLALDTWFFSAVYRALLKDMQGWMTLYFDPLSYVKMFVLSMAVYLAVALLQLRKIRRVPMDEALKNVGE